MGNSLHILVTAGPTREAIDPVRFISNPSSGKMGYAVAAAALERGHEVLLVSGPVPLAPPAGAVPVSVVTAEEMLAAVRDNVGWCDALVMAAAVCDWRPRSVAEHKLKKSQMSGTLKLERTPDVLLEIADLKQGRTYVGFAAETRDLEREARRKLAEKGLDMIVANDIAAADSGFGSDTNRAMIMTADAVEEPALLTKTELAERIVVWIEQNTGSDVK